MRSASIQPLQCILYSLLSLDKKFKHLYSISQIQNKVFNISFWLSPFTRMGLLNISFSPAHYIFLEITLSLFTAILQAISTKCQRDALGYSVACYCLDM